MVDCVKLHKAARHDVRMCIQAWSETLRKFLGDRLDYMYAKGSAVKAWDSPIDYVPILSDVDVHIRLTDDDGFFVDASDPFEFSMSVITEHERRFYELEPEPLHFPRSQIVILNMMEKEEWYVPPRPEDITVIVGAPRFEEQPSPERARAIDCQKLEEIDSVLQNVPLSMIDRSGPDFWILVRRLSWRVSPAPLRLLSQVHSDPLAVWSWNRTSVVRELKELGHDSLATNYVNYYNAGWDLFLSDLKSTDAYRRLLYHGHYVLRETLRILGAL